MDKFRHKLPKEELKKLARDINKKLVASDYKNSRVDDPTTITTKQEKKVKQHVKDFFDRAVEKFKTHEKKKAERAARHAARDSKDAHHHEPSGAATVAASKEVDVHDTEGDMAMSEVGRSPSISSDRKRKREEDEDADSTGQMTPSETPSAKRLKEDEADVPFPPPPPPPPPQGEGASETPMTEEERSMREQEEALMRENEEAQRLEEEAEAEAEAEAAKLDAGMGQQLLNEHGAHASSGLDGYGVNGAGDDAEGNGSSMDHEKGRKQEVLSH